MPALKHVTDATFNQEVLNNDKPVLADSGPSGAVRAG